MAQEGIRPMMFRQERGALMAADGFSRLNNRKKFGVVITQGGPGAENAMDVDDDIARPPLDFTVIKHQRACAVDDNGVVHGFGLVHAA